MHVRLEPCPSNRQFRKGIVLAGGSGSRLHLLTRATSKQLLPIYGQADGVLSAIGTKCRPGFSYILLISTPEDIGGFQRLFGDGSQFGLTIEFAVQPRPEGLAQAFIIGPRIYWHGSSLALVLGDNLFCGPEPPRRGLAAGNRIQKRRKRSLVCPVDDPHRYGVVEFDHGWECDLARGKYRRVPVPSLRCPACISMTIKSSTLQQQYKTFATRRTRNHGYKSRIS